MPARESNARLGNLFKVTELISNEAVVTPAHPSTQDHNIRNCHTGEGPEAQLPTPHPHQALHPPPTLRKELLFLSTDSQQPFNRQESLTFCFKEPHAPYPLVPRVCMTWCQPSIQWYHVFWCETKCLIASGMNSGLRCHSFDLEQGTQNRARDSIKPLKKQVLERTLA